MRFQIIEEGSDLNDHMLLTCYTLCIEVMIIKTDFILPCKKNHALITLDVFVNYQLKITLKDQELYLTKFISTELNPKSSA